MTFGGKETGAIGGISGLQYKRSGIDPSALNEQSFKDSSSHLAH